MKLAVVGASLGQACGVRDHATLLADALERDGIACSLHWLARDAQTLRASRAQDRTWMRALAAELRNDRPDAVLLHYSVFAYSYRGVPLFVRPLLATLRGARVPLVAFGHELAFPWGRGGWRGTLWAVTQRALLVELVRACAALILTADFRVRWLDSRRWLSRRPIALAPVFSNLPPPVAARGALRERARIGLFGYSYHPRAIALVLDALALLRDRGLEPELALLGAPGRHSHAAEQWLAAACRHGIERALSFSGVLPAQELSDALADCEILLFADTPGPTSRKTTLAASLASGRPLVAVDGPDCWSELRTANAVRVAARTAGALADALDALLADEPARAALGARGRAFAEQRMTVASVAAVVSAVLGGVLGERPACQAPA